MKRGRGRKGGQWSSILACLLMVGYGGGATVLAQNPADGRKGQPILVISVDGLDYRYLRDADQLGLKIPTLRRLWREGEVVEGIRGVYPTVTWPSHTTLITGVTPAEHGILSNRRPRAEGGDYYWDVSLLRTRTLWEKATAAGLKTAAITWPVTVGAEIDFNLPEYFQKRRGGAMDLPSIESKATPGLVEKIARAYPSFAQEWMDDRTRAIATRYLLEVEKPDLILLHLVDLDSEAHEMGPFTREAHAILEYTDELIGQMISVLPGGMVVALVSDHGFERADRVLHMPSLLRKEGVSGSVTTTLGLVTTGDQQVASWLRKASRENRYGIGREVPEAEIRDFAPHLLQSASGAGIVAAFEPAPHTVFGTEDGEEIYGKPREMGVHGLWPGRADYAATFVLWGRGISPGRRPSASMLTIAPRLEEILLPKKPR
jgi:predicted AlkP superfamily pyrophosphatase or phosphodiesterase